MIAQFDGPPSDRAGARRARQHYPARRQIIQSWRRSAIRPSASVMIRVPQAGAEQGTSLSAEAAKVEAALKQGNVGNFTIVGREIVGPPVGEGTDEQGLLGDRAVARRHSRLHRVPVPVQLRGRRRRRHDPRPAGDARVSASSSATT